MLFRHEEYGHEPQKSYITKIHNDDNQYDVNRYVCPAATPQVDTSLYQSPCRNGQHGVVPRAPISVRSSTSK